MFDMNMGWSIIHMFLKKYLYSYTYSTSSKERIAFIAGISMEFEYGAFGYWEILDKFSSGSLSGVKLILRLYSATYEHVHSLMTWKWFRFQTRIFWTDQISRDLSKKLEAGRRNVNTTKGSPVLAEQKTYSLPLTRDLRPQPKNIALTSTYEEGPGTVNGVIGIKHPTCLDWWWMAVRELTFDDLNTFP